MKAAAIERYGGDETVVIKDLPLPACGAGDVLIRVIAAGINPLDWKVRYGQSKILTGNRFPIVLGNECAGEVVETGRDVRKVAVGDGVIGWPGVRRLGAFAEYACAAEGAVFRKPQALSFEQAAGIPIAGLTALQALRDYARIAYGKKVLINGASGGVGHFAVQIAKLFGAEVTAVCSAANIPFVQGLGADNVIDYAKQDFTAGGARYDIIFDAVAKRSFGECRQALSPRGIYVSTLPSPAVILNQYVTGFFTSKKAATVWVRQKEADMNWLIGRIEAGRVRTMIDRRYPLDRAKEALAYSETGKARGKIILNISDHERTA